MVATAEYFRRHRWAWIASTTAFWNDPAQHRQKERMTRRDRYERYLRSLIQERSTPANCATSMWRWRAASSCRR